jgi:peptidyl-prolyl cis-trans isomerase SurA
MSNKRVSTLLVLFSICFFHIANAQFLLQVGDKKISKEEFLKTYNKNNANNDYSEKALKEYLDLFINYKLKVFEAEALKMDTLQHLRRELYGYRAQLATPYLTDIALEDQMVKEAYERSLPEVNASHILIGCPDVANPKDTLAAYKKIMSIKKRLDKGESFEKLAAEFSMDTVSAKVGGNLGFFTVFTMVYPFESVAYNTPVGEVSNPIRTRYGYHIIKPIAHRPARGDVKVSHILVKLSRQSTAEDSALAKSKIDSIYAKLKAGENFEEAAKKYSEDRVSGRLGGSIDRYFGTGKMIQPFEDKSFELTKDGDISEPFLTRFGWHIVKRIDKREIGSFADNEYKIRQNIKNDSRAVVRNEAFVNTLKSRYNYQEVKKSLQEVTKAIDTSIYKYNWSASKAANLSKALFTFDTVTISQKDFAEWIEDNQPKLSYYPIKEGVTYLYKLYVDETLLNYTDKNLENNYPEFKALIEEYRDGILLFELSEKMVWNRAIEDSVGLDSFYKANIKNYLWSTRADASVFTCENEEVAKTLRKLLKKGKMSVEEIQTQINQNNPNLLSVLNGKFEKGDNKLIDSLKWEVQITKEIPMDNKIVIVKVNEILSPSPKNLEEIKGTVIADYQNDLEKQWIVELRSKYQPKVNEEEFKSLLNKN